MSGIGYQLGDELVKGTPVVEENFVYFINWNETICRVNMETNKTEKYLKCSATSTPSVRGGRLFWRNANSELMMINTDNLSLNPVLITNILTSKYRTSD